MEALTHVWRPRPAIRATAIGLPLREDRLLVSAVTDDSGATQGWRPLGGGIEFGEHAEAAVVREFREEVNAVVCVTARLGVLENIFSHHGKPGHEVIFAFDIELKEPGLAKDETFIVEDNGYRNRAAWLPMKVFEIGRERLLPDGLLPLVPWTKAP